MKKTLSLILSLILIAAFATFSAEAKIFHQCHCCGGDGIYTCDAKDCKGGKLPCGRCNGTGQTVEKCGACGGTGKCSMCKGTGKRTGDNTIDCDNCKGTGKCQGGPGWGPCTQGYYYNKCQDCGGKGVVWHNSEWCVYARNHGGKCPICKGTGYEGDGVEGTPNDGVSNVPHAGDGIYYLNGSYAVYGGGASGKKSSGGSSSDSKPSGGSSSDSKPSGGSSNTVSSTADTLTASKESNTSKNNELLPEDKHKTIYLGTSSVDNDDFAGTTATGVILYQDMTDAQKKVYDSMTDEKLDELLVNLRDIISTVKIGEVSGESQGLVDAFRQANGIKNLADANIFPVSFDGHIEIGFPILVSVEVDPDIFDGSKPIRVFHIKEDALVQIPKEDISWITREEDKKVSRIEFYTDSFSDFLFSDVEGLVVPTDIESKSEEGLVVADNAEKNFDGKIILVIIAVFAVIITVALAAFILKKRKKHDSVDEIQKIEEFDGEKKDG